MDYITTTEAADKWKISRRRVSLLCAEGRVQGACQVGDRWLVPMNIDKPEDQRRHTQNVEKSSSNEDKGDWIDYLNKTLTIPATSKYSAVDLFAGCGGLSLGFEAAGIKTTGYEMVGDCCDTYSRNLSSECFKTFIDEKSEYHETDILIGGPPCQPFSRFGKQLGESDSRNGFPAFISAVRRYKPDIWIFENVKGLPESMPEYYESVLEELKGLGYEVEAHVVKMVKYNVPQTRERMVVVGPGSDN